MRNTVRTLVAGTIDALLFRGNVASIPSISARQFVGSGFATLIDIGLFQGLLWFRVVGIMSAAPIAFATSVIVNYLITSYYVFRHVGGGLGKPRRFAMYCVSCIFSLGLNQLIIWLMSVVIGLPPLAGKLISVFVLFFWHQLLHRKIIFTPDNS